jgi:phosphatidylglycerophosphate synthase
MTSGTSNQEKKPIFTDRLRVRFQKDLDRIGGFLLSLGITPNMLTLLGVFGNLVGAVLIAFGYLTAGGLVLLLMGAMDALDGTMARLKGTPSKWGGFVDSVSDRYSELLIFAGLLVYYLDRGNNLISLLIFVAAAGSVMVSYTRARALSLGYEVKRGLLTRAERFFILTPMIIIGYPQIGIVIIAIFANFTAFQRIYYVHNEAVQE